MKRLIPILIIFLSFSFPAFVHAQGDDLAYNEEFTYGINFNTNGGLIGGVNFKWAMDKGPKQYQSFGFELVNVKHPKEYRFRSLETGNSFLGYKTHYLFVFRPFYGREFTLFRKAAEEGVFVNLILAGGPSLGMRKPYYILYRDNPSQDSPYSSIPYNSTANLGQINGVGSFSDGLNNMDYSLGVHAKIALSFEFGQIKTSVAGLEVGLMVEKFAKEQQIIAFAINSSLFTSAYISLFFGRKY